MQNSQKVPFRLNFVEMLLLVPKISSVLFSGKLPRIITQTMHYRRPLVSPPLDFRERRLLHYLKENPCGQNYAKMDDFIAIYGPINCALNRDKIGNV